MPHTRVRITHHPLFRLGIGPFLGFAACYFILTFPLVLSFGRAFLCDDGDGPQFIWDIWVVRSGYVAPWNLPWQTPLVHYPPGVSLLLHTLTPFNGLLAIPLTWVLGSAVLVFNTIITFTFAMSGLTTFWLAHWATRRAYWPSLAAGFGFAFCSYRFAHAIGHLHVISTEWTPLYMLSLLTLLDRPSVKLALAAAGTLLLVLLCDQYQFMTCALATVIALLVNPPKLDRASVRAAVAFALVALLLCGPIAIGTLLVGRREPLVGLHDAESFSADLLNPFIPGWTWHYRALTRLIWQPIGSYIETSVCIGPAILIAACFGIGRARRIWRTLAIAFIALSLGPTWYVWTYPITRWTPYRLLEWIVPALKMAGNPARMIVMAQLACCVMAAIGLERLRDVSSSRTRASLIVLFVLVLVIGSQPSVMQPFAPDVPRWVNALRDRHEPGALIDLVSGDRAIGLYAQTVHHRPIAQGDISRIPRSADDAAKAILARVDDGKFAELRAMGFAFIAQPVSSAKLSLPIVFEDRLARVYRIEMESK